MYPTEAKDLGAHGGEWVGLDPLQCYEAVLWAACQRALETAEASKVTLRGSMMNVEEGHKSTAIVEVDPEPGLEVNLGPTLEVNLGPNLETGLGPFLGAK